MDTYEYCDGIDLATAVRRAEVSAEELLQEAIARVKALNPALNCIAYYDAQAGRDSIGQASPNGPFYGVPFLLKDLSATAAGLPLGNGSRFFQGERSTEDSELVARYRRAGLVIFGTTTTPEFGANCTTEALAYGGPTRNPWDLNRSGGGSSGGSAVAVAAGIVPVAHGGDGGGSLRIPASACGLFGFKPSRMRNPTGPTGGEGWGGLAGDNVISRSVRDSAAMLDFSHGMDAGTPYAAPPFSGSFLKAAGQPPGKLRIGLITRSPSGEPVHPDCLAAAEDAAALCASLGHQVEPTDFPAAIDYERFGHAMRLIVASGMASAIRAREQALGRHATHDDLELSVFSAVEFARSHSAVEYFDSVSMMHSIGRHLGRLMGQYDVLLTPTLTEPPVELGRYAADKEYVAHRSATLKYTAFLPYFNASGQPAMSVPLYWNEDGLPIGVQFAAALGGEALLFSLASQLEAARPWFHRRPDCLVATPATVA
ncbi:amidase [Kerstersia gyiorum]|uniref:amidase n=1 Tax=Kerstersia gyiorum TaxID=206506 RepID=UPI003B429C6E